MLIKYWEEFKRDSVVPHESSEKFLQSTSSFDICKVLILQLPHRNPSLEMLKYLL